MLYSQVMIAALRLMEICHVLI